MSLLQILHYPDKRLHLKAKSIRVIDDSIKTLVQNMIHTMYDSNGIGLAASQVNMQLRLFIMDISKDDEPKNVLTFINPEILSRSGEVIGEEGCLSVPGVYESVLRSEWITVKYQDINSQEHTIDCSGLMAVCIQHEIDHLDGKVFVDYLSPLKQNFIKKKMKKIYKPE